MTATVRGALYLGKVWLLVAFIRLGLWAMPFVVIRRLARRWGRHTSHDGPAGRRRPEALVRAVRRVGRFVPRASCLTQALAAEVLLGRAGHAPRLRIGLRREDSGALSAHAWVENGGEVVFGDREVERFTPLPALERP
jgi:hypothetical protein